MSSTECIERVLNAKNRIAMYERRRAEKLALLEVLKGEYNKNVEKVKAFGIENVNDLPKTIQELEAELVAKLDTTEALLDQAEGMVNG